MSDPTDTRNLRRVIAEALMATPFGEPIPLTADRVADAIVGQQWLITGGKARTIRSVESPGSFPEDAESGHWTVYTNPEPDRG